MRILLSSLLVLLLLAPAPGEAAPVDARVGQTRAAYLKAGTPLRAQPNALGAATATLASGTQVRIEEVKLPWLRVTALDGSSTGWLRAFETVEPAALTPNPQAVRISADGRGVTSRDVAAAGRQLDAGTERGYRRTRADLDAAYQWVDQMEAATSALDPAACIEFILQGRLGRQGRDYARPALLPPSGRSKSGRRRTQPGTRPRGKSPLGGFGGLIEKVGGGVGGDIGKVLRSKEAKAAGDVVEGLSERKRQLSNKFTAQQEYYLGRAVSAYAIAKFGIDPDPNRRAYVRQVGDAIVRLSKRLPRTFGGYHFDVLDCDDVNGVSGPGGFVLLTRGAVMACRTEAELAGLLCHELAHVTRGHGERVLRKSKSMEPMLAGITRGLSRVAGVEGGMQARLVEFFGKAATDMSRTAVETGYGRDLEFDADAEGTNILFDVYYEQDALQKFLMRMPAHQHGHAGTHAPPQARAGALTGLIARWAAFPVDAQASTLRSQRFQAHTGIASPR